jgi:hypothetical protein
MAKKLEAKRGIYRSYFFKDHDPKMDAIDRVYELAGMLTDKGIPRFAKIAELSDVSEATLRNHRSRATKRPQNASMEAILRGLGAYSAVMYKGRVVRYGGPALTAINGGRKKA